MKMYGKANKNSVPSDAQSREKLATYVYEYLYHVGAKQAAQLFLTEIGWDKNIHVMDSPGFLHSWWCVFWDLYCASPEKRDTCEHSTEAKAFHDYSSTSGASSLNQIPPDGMGQAGLPPSYYPPFMSPRYPPGAPRPGMQGPGGPQSMMQGMDHPRQGQMMGMSRMVHPRGIPPGSMNPYGSDQFQQPYAGMRLPTSSTMPGHGGMGMPPMHGRSPWPNQSGPSGPASVGPPTTPILRSPQSHRPTGSTPHRFPHNHDPKNPDPMNSDYVHLNKQLSHQAMSSSFPMGGTGPDNLPPSTIPAGQAPGMAVSTPNITSGLNGMNGAAPDPAIMDGLPKNSPGNNIAMNQLGPGAPSGMVPPGGTPHTPQEGAEGDSFNINFGDNHQDQNDTAAILKIKESMQQDVKRFETKENDTAPGPDFNFMP